MPKVTGLMINVASLRLSLQNFKGDLRVTNSVNPIEAILLSKDISKADNEFLTNDVRLRNSGCYETN